MWKSKKIWGSFIVLGSIGITVPFITNLVKKVEDDKISVMFDDKNFTSRRALTSYVRENATIETFSTGEKAFTLKDKGMNVMFKDAVSAVSYIENNKVKTRDVYLRNGYESAIDPITNQIPEDYYVEANKAKFFNTYKKYDGGYTFSDANNIEASNRAKKDAALSYVNLHNAYHFNGYYFDNKATLETYLRNDYVPNTINESDKLSLITENGARVTFESENDPSIDSWVLENAEPVYSLPGKDVDFTSEQLSYLSNAVPEERMDIIQMESNEGERTSIVDMDASTPNGSLYGPYFIKSGIDVGSIDEYKNWNVISNSKSHQGNNDVVEKVSFTLDTLISNIEDPISVNSLVSFMDKIKPYNNKNIFEYLGTSDPGIEKFILNLEKGSRYTSFNALVSTYAWGINKMIKQGAKNYDIRVFANYFKKITEVLDAKLFAHLNDFLSKFDIENNEFTFFQKIFKFNDLNFQKNLFTYESDILYDDELKTIYSIISMQSSFSMAIYSNIRKNDKILKDFHYQNVAIPNLKPNFEKIVISEEKFIKMKSENQVDEITSIPGISKIQILNNINTIRNITNNLIDQYYETIKSKTSEYWDSTYTTKDLFKFNFDFIKYNSFYNDFMTEAATLLKNFLETRNKFIEDSLNAINNAFGDFVSNYNKEINLAVKIIGNYINMYLDLLSLVEFLNPFVAFASIVFKFAKSFFPESEFSGSRTKTYEYTNKEDSGKSYKWDGGEEVWAFWGLWSDVRFTIKDLKMIDTEVVVDPYTKDGYYVDGQIYKSAAAAKQHILESSLEYVTRTPRIQMLDNELENIKWKINLSNGSTESYSNISDLISYVKKVITNISNSIYETSEGIVTDKGRVIESSIDSWLSTLKPVHILVKPEVDFNGEYRKTPFKLPTPYISVNGINEEKMTSSEISRYMIINRNINEEELIKMKDINPEIANFLMSTRNKTEKEIIEKLQNKFSNILEPKTKRVIFDEINDQGAIINFDNLSENLKYATIFTVKSKLGKQSSFVRKTHAISLLSNEENMNYSIIETSRNYIQYLINDLVSSSINNIVDQIINNQGGKYV